MKRIPIKFQSRLTEQWAWLALGVAMLGVPLVMVGKLVWIMAGGGR